jgi:hypothetical protein
MRRIVVKKGDEYGRLKIVKEVEKYKGIRSFECLCSCGLAKTITLHNLRNGVTKSCGCLLYETRVKNGQRKYTHGHARQKSRTYHTWLAMKLRCLNEKHLAYNRYGGRGIKICKEWFSFENFLKDMGERPEGKSLDRIDNDGDYCKENCRWATAKEQANNRKQTKIFSLEGKEYSIPEMSKFLNVPSQFLRNRLNANWDVNEIINTPKQSKKISVPLKAILLTKQN